MTYTENLAELEFVRPRLGVQQSLRNLRAETLLIPMRGGRSSIL